MLKRTNITHPHDLAALLPKYSFTRDGVQMEPINVVIFGHQKQLDRHFVSYGWVQADRLNLPTLIRAGFASWLNLPYRNGPVADSYVRGKRFAISYEKPTIANTYRRRHHLRLWRTPLKYRGLPVWAGTASYDHSMGLSSSNLPTHHIAPTLLWEEGFLAHSLGISQIRYIKLGKAVKRALNNNGDHYDYDGHAVVINLSRP